jgi:pimeloyl-[acyl-carrier protein] methyl ester esterase
MIIVVLAVALLGTRGLDPPPPSTHNAFGRGPGIVLVHGLGSNASHWLPTARLLARHYRVSLVDLPGHGVTAMPDPFSLERAALGLDLALRDDGDGDPVILVGHSLGGLVAAATALQNPRLVRGLVLVEAALKPQVPAEQRAALLAELDRDYRGFVRQAYLGFGRDSAQGERLWAEVEPIDPANVKPWIRLAFTADLSGRTPRLDVPVLAVLAERSWPKDEPWAVTAKALGYEGLPNLRAARIADSGHFVMLDHPRELATLIDRFAATLGDPPIALR